MCSDDPPPAPDYSAIAAASEKSAQIAADLQREQMAWAKQVYAENKGVTDQVVESFLQTQADNKANAEEDRARYEQIFQPLENDLAQEAMSYNSPERKDFEIGRAEANVAQQFEAARQSHTRELESFGIDPGDLRFAALDIGVRTQKAAAEAAAGTNAANMVDATGRALRSEAINVGRGYPGQIAGTYNTALQAGTGANNAGLATTASGANTMGTGAQWAGIGNQAIGQWGNTVHTGYVDQANAWKQGQEGSGWGSALGLAAGIGAGFMGLPTASVGGKLLGFAEGGAIPVDGGTVPEQVSPSGGQQVDDVPAQVSVGEFIIPKDVVQWYGEKHMYKLIEKADTERSEAKEVTGAIPSFKEPPKQTLEV